MTTDSFRLDGRTLALAGLLIGFTLTVSAAQWHPLSQLRITEDLDMQGYDILNIGAIGSVDSTAKVNNLNADRLDGQDGTYYLDDTDTNAQTICSGSKALTGDGSCMNVGGRYLPSDPATSSVDMNNNQINDLAAPTASDDAATKGYWMRRPAGYPPVR